MGRLPMSLPHIISPFLSGVLWLWIGVTKTLTSLPSGITLVSFFVTRLKSNATYEVVKDCPLPQHSNVLTDQLIQFTGYQCRQKFPGLLRRVVVWDEDNQRKIELLANHLRFGATTIGRIYRDRWEIKLFFKVLKQHLKIKTFVDTTPNALKIQIWKVLIAVLLLKYLQFRSKCNLPLCRLVALLFSYRNLWDWLDNIKILTSD